MEDVLKCPKCKRKQTRFRLKTNDIICNNCGNIYKKEEDEY